MLHWDGTPPPNVFQWRRSHIELPARGCHEDVTRKMVPWNLSLTALIYRLTYRTHAISYYISAPAERRDELYAGRVGIPCTTDSSSLGACRRPTPVATNNTQHERWPVHWTVRLTDDYGQKPGRC